MKPAYYLALGLALALEGWSSFAQTLNLQTTNPPQLLPAAPTRLDLAAAGDAAVQPLPGLSSVTDSGTSTPAVFGISRAYMAASSRTADTNFFLLNGAHLGMAVFDVEMTQRCIADHRCHEGNPLAPASRAGQLGVNFTLVGFSAWSSYWLKKHKSKLWWLPPATGATAHGIGVITGFEHQ